MATNQSTNVKFNKMTQFDNVVSKINQTFQHLIDQLIARRNALLQRVRELKEDHISRETSRIAAIEELEMVQQQMQEMGIKRNPNNEFRQQFKKAYQQGIKKLEPPATFLCPLFKSQRQNTIQQLIADLGEIFLCEIPDYSLKKEPILTAGKRGGSANELYAAGIAFDDITELTYLADWGNSRIQIMSLRGEFLAQFRNDKLVNPWGIDVTNEYIFITDIGIHAVLQYSKKDFKLINRVGARGSKEGELNDPHGLCIDTNGDVFIADTHNNRISIFSKLLKFETCIGIGNLYYPIDVKLISDRVVVLDWSPNSVHFFSREGSFLSSCIPPQHSDSSLNAPYFFCLDRAGNIIISDRYSHDIKIFNELGQHLYTIGQKGDGRGEFIYPSGICLSKLGTISVVSENPNYSLQSL